MSDLKKLNNAIAGIDDGLLADTMSSSETKQSGGRLRAVLGAVAAVAIIGGLAGLSLFLTKIAGPKQPASAPDNTAAGTEDAVGVSLDEMLERVYSHPGTSKMKFRLKQTVTDEDMKDYLKKFSYGGICQYYDPDYDLTPVYYCESDDRLMTDEEIEAAYENGGGRFGPDWVSGTPYVRYDVNGYPSRDDDNKAVVHVDILDEKISVCGLTVNSSLDEAEKVLTELGFTVTRNKTHKVYSCKTDREILEAHADGFWIIFEEASEMKSGFAKDVYPYTDFILYRDNVMPAIIRMGISVDGYSSVDQFLIP